MHEQQQQQQQHVVNLAVFDDGGGSESFLGWQMLTARSSQQTDGKSGLAPVPSRNHARMSSIEA